MRCPRDRQSELLSCVPHDLIPCSNPYLGPDTHTPALRKERFRSLQEGNTELALTFRGWPSLPSWPVVCPCGAWTTSQDASPTHEHPET